jgi:hypothetical protein
MAFPIAILAIIYVSRISANENEHHVANSFREGLKEMRRDRRAGIRSI